MQYSRADTGEDELDPDDDAKVLLVSSSNAVPSLQCRQVRMPPASIVANDTTVAVSGHGRHDFGGCSCAQPNQVEPKKPRMAAVAAASRINSVSIVTRRMSLEPELFKIRGIDRCGG
jgi:hypothetical protein